MSAASVTAYLSPTMARKRAISSGESSGATAAGLTIFMVAARLLLSSFLLRTSAAADRGAAEPVVDSLAQAVIWHRHHGDAAGAFGVEATKVTEKIGGCFRQIAAHRKIHHRDRGFRPCCRLRAERQQRFASLDSLDFEPDLAARRVMRDQHAWRQRCRGVAGRGLGRPRQRVAKHALDRLAR